MTFQNLCRAVVVKVAILALLSGPVMAQDVDFGDDASEWATDGECDDPRFAGDGAAAEMDDVDLMHDATDCQAAFDAGTVTLLDSLAADDSEDVVPATDNSIVARIDFGDDSGEFTNDGECDDPDFHGVGMAQKPSSANRMADASDCRAAFEAGTIALGAEAAAAEVAAFDYGSDWSKWANDGECDDLRFAGEGADKKLLLDDMYGDATDCEMLEAEGTVTIRTVYTPEYAAGAPYDSSDIEFGDNTSSYADNDQCDDPRFEGPGAASTLLESDLMLDSADCKEAFEAGTIVLLEDA